MRKLLLIGLCLAAGCGKNEPSYQGKSASSWVRALKSPETRPDASHALEELGPSAIPTALIDGLRNEDPAVREAQPCAEEERQGGRPGALNDALKHPHDLDAPAGGVPAERTGTGCQSRARGDPRGAQGPEPASSRLLRPGRSGKWTSRKTRP